MLTKNEKAIAINLAMDIDLGVVSLNTVLNEIKKKPKAWISVLEFWGECSPLTINILKQLFIQKCFDLPSRKGIF